MKKLIVLVAVTTCFGCLTVPTFGQSRVPYRPPTPRPSTPSYRPSTPSYRPPTPSYHPPTPVTPSYTPKPAPSYMPMPVTPSYKPQTTTPTKTGGQNQYSPPPTKGQTIHDRVDRMLVKAQSPGAKPTMPSPPSYPPKPGPSSYITQPTPPSYKGGQNQVFPSTAKVQVIQDRVDRMLVKAQSVTSPNLPTEPTGRGFAAPSTTPTVPIAEMSVTDKVDRLLAGIREANPGGNLNFVSPSAKSRQNPGPTLADTSVKLIQMPNLPWVDPGPLASPSPTKLSGAGAKPWVVEKGSLGDVLGKNDKVVAQFSTEAEADRFANDANHKAPLGTLYTVTQRPSQAANSKPAANADLPKPGLLAEALAKAYNPRIDITMPPPIKAPMPPSASVPAPSTRAPAPGRIAGDRSGAGLVDRAIEVAKWAEKIYEQYVEPAKQLKHFAENSTKPFDNAIKDPPTAANIAKKWMTKQGLDYLESLRDTRWMEDEPLVRRAVDSVIRMIREANDPSVKRQMKDSLENR